jgi:4-amino-4-deoxy-L-arabinose transferase-like glycosyltransferase
VFFLFAGAAALRFWGIAQGLPHPSTRPDEREVLQYTLPFSSGDLNPGWFIYPSLYLYLVWIWGAAALALQRLIVTTPGYRDVFAEALPTLLLYGRALSAVAGTLTVVVVYGIGRRLESVWLGLIAALLVATNLLHVRDSHALKPDALVTLATLLTVWWLAAWQQEPSRIRTIVAGLAIAVTTGIKYNGILLLVPAYVADVWSSNRAGWRHFVPSWEFALLVTVAVLAFFATNPYFVIDFARFRDTFFFSMWTEYSQRAQARPAADTAWPERLWSVVRSRTFGYHLWVSLRLGCGLAVALLTPFALALALRAPRRPFWVLSAVFVVVHYLVVAASPVHLTRYFTPLVPFLALAVARLVLVAAALAPRPALRTAVGAGLTAALVAQPLAGSVAQDAIAATTDTRVLALDWMTANFAPGSVAAVIGSGAFSYADPILPPGVPRLPANVAPAEFARHGVTHVVTHEHQLPFSHPNPAVMRQLAPHLRLLAEFSPYRDGPAGLFEDEDAYYVPLADFCGVERQGPVVRVYAYSP